MKLRFVTRGVELTTDLKDYVRRRVHFALGRFAGNIRSVTIRLADVNGPRGGVDKCCHIRVDVRSRQQVIVHECQGNIYAAVAFAVERVDRAVQRYLKSDNIGRYENDFER